MCAARRVRLPIQNFITPMDDRADAVGGAQAGRGQLRFVFQGCTDRGRSTIPHEFFSIASISIDTLSEAA